MDTLLTPAEKSQLLLKHGYDPSKVTFDENTGEISPLIAEAPKASATELNPLAEQAKQTTALPTPAGSMARHAAASVPGFAGGLATAGAAGAALSMTGAGALVGIPLTVLSALAGSHYYNKAAESLYTPEFKKNLATDSEVNQVSSFVGDELLPLTTLKPDVRSLKNAAQGIRQMLPGGTGISAANANNLVNLGVNAGMPIASTAMQLINDPERKVTWQDVAGAGIGILNNNPRGILKYLGQHPNTHSSPLQDRSVDPRVVAQQSAKVTPEEIQKAAGKLPIDVSGVRLKPKKKVSAEQAAVDAAAERSGVVEPPVEVPAEEVAQAVPKQVVVDQPAPVKEPAKDEVVIPAEYVDKPMYPLINSDKGWVDQFGRAVNNDRNLVEATGKPLSKDPSIIYPKSAVNAEEKARLAAEKQAAEDKANAEAEAGLKHMQADDSETTPEQTKAVADYFKQLGVNVHEVKWDSTEGKFRAKDENGNEVVTHGYYDPKTNRIVADQTRAETSPHELTHKLVDTLRKSSNPADQKLVGNILDSINNSKELKDINETRTKEGKAPWDAEELLARTTGERAIDQINTKDYSLVKDFLAGAKAKWGTPSVADSARVMANNIRFGKPAGEIVNPIVKATGAVQHDRADEKPITIQRPDGSTYEATTDGKYWEHPDRGQVLSIVKDGSHGMLPEGDKVVGDTAKHMEADDRSERKPSPFDEIRARVNETPEATATPAERPDVATRREQQSSQGMDKALNQKKFMASDDEPNLTKGYGAWLAPDGKVHPVREMGHEDEALKILRSKGVEITPKTDVYQEMHNRGYARVVNEGDGTYSESTKPLTTSQRRVMRDHGIENNRLMVHSVSSTSGANMLREPRYDIIHNPHDKSQFMEAEHPFSTDLEEQAKKEQPFGLLKGKDDAIPTLTLQAKIRRQIPAEEMNMLNEGGKFDKFLESQKGRVKMSELNKWLEENAPKVQVHEYGQNGKVSEAKKKYDKMSHEWYDTLPRGAKSVIDQYNHNIEYPRAGSEKAANDYADELENDYRIPLSKVRKYLDLKNLVEKEPPDRSLRATSAYNHVSPHDTTKYPVQRVDVVVPREQYTKAEQDNLSGKWKDKWIADGLHENLPNTLGWAAIQYHDLPNGEKVAHVFEAQSRWGQELRNEKAKAEDRLSRGLPEGPVNYKVKQIDHPLLADYNRLILKAAIKQAKANGATHIMISDAETAMMTEGHDLNATFTGKLKLPPDKVKLATKDGWSVFDGRIQSTGPELVKAYKKYGGELEYDQPKQEEGMRQNYDQSLPNIAAKLTGDKGEQMSLGEHKNAFEGPNAEGAYDLGNLMGTRHRPRNNLIFKNPDGTPKTDVTGRKFSLENIPDRPAKLFRKKFMEADEDPTTAGDVEIPNETDATKHAFLKSLTPAYDAVRRVSVPLSEGFKNFEKDRDKLLGYYYNEPMTKLAKYDARDIQQAHDRRIEMTRDGTSDIELTPKQKEVDALLEHMSSIKDVSNALNMTESKGRTPYYAPQIVSRKVMDLFKKAPNSPEAMALRNEWARHLVDESAGTEEEFSMKQAQAKIQGYISTLTSKTGVEQTDFNALRKLQGYGLPDSLLEPSAIDAWTRYMKRASTDISFYKNLEADPVNSKLLGIGEDSAQHSLKNTVEVQRALQAAYRKYDNAPDDPALKVSRVLNSAIMGVKTGIMNFGNAGISMMPYMNRVSDMMAFPRALLHLPEAKAGSLRENARQPNLVGNMMLDPETANSWVDNAARWMRSPREVLEQGSRIYTFAVGKELARVNAARAAEGDTAAIDFMKKFGRGGQDIDNVAANFTKRVEGTYGGEGLPSGINEGMIAPFAQLSKWSVEKSNIIYQDVVNPMIKDGNFKPFIYYTLAGLVGGEGLAMLNDWMNQHKRGVATPAELKAKPDNWMALADGVATAAQAGGYAGLISDIAKMGFDKAAYGQTSHGVNIPLFSFLQDTLAENLSDANQAIKAGEPMHEVALALVQKIIVDSTQNARLLVNAFSTDKQAEHARQDKFRDLRIFKTLEGNTPPKFDPTVSNPFINKTEQKFKRTTDIAEAAKLLPGLISKYAKNPEDLIKKLDGLKQNSYQTMPNPEQDVIEFGKYYDFLKRVLGPEGAQERLVDYIKQTKINEAKREMVPSVSH